MKLKFITQALHKIRHVRVNRKYKDHLFRFVFQNKKDLLDLYNAVNGTDYQDPEELEITTLQDVVYLGMKNDVSFLIGNYMNLYEHQSTFSPNMPLRGLLYFADMYRAYIAINDLNLYASKQVMIPTPKYVIFYNGTKDEPERVELRLSDAFEEKDEEAALECRALMLNINYGHNKELMKKCKRLEDYAYFIQSIRKYLAGGNSLEKAAELAISECIEKNILADILCKNRAEVLNLLLTVYDKKLHEKTLREEGREEGRAEGLEEGRAEGREEGRAEGREEGRAEGREEGRAEGREEGRAEERERSLKALAQAKEYACRLLAEAYCEAGLSKIDTLHRLMEKYALEQPEAETIVNEVYEQK